MFIRKHAFRLICLCLTMLVLITCVPPTTAPTPMLSPLAVPEATAKPDTTEATLAISPLPLPAETPTGAPRTPGMGAVVGQLERFDGTPLKGIFVYAALIEERSGVRLAAVDPLLDVHTATDAQGGFRFDNLAPGEYALAMQSPVGIIMPHNTDGEVVKFTIKADDQIALGRLTVGYVYPDND